VSVSGVRPFVAADASEVARLYGGIAAGCDTVDSVGLESLCAYIKRVFVENPSCDATLPSLVYEHDDGRIVGFLGVIPRWMSINGQRVRVAVGSQFRGDPTSRTAVVGLELAKAFLAGPQDISISDEADDLTRKIWEGLGGTTALLHSIHWTRPLRPARLALSFLRKRTALAPLVAVADPPARIVDLLATHLRQSHLYQCAPSVSVDDEPEDVLLARWPEFADSGALHVEYDATTFRWLLEQCASRKTGTLRKAVIRNGQQIMGGYLVHLGSDGMADVLLIVAKPDSIRDVLDCLFYELWRRGAIAVNGRLEPRFMQAFSDKYCFFHRRGPWMLVAARKPELLRLFVDTTAALFSRLDGEWCLGF
jgi:hypothetical protein